MLPNNPILVIVPDRVWNIWSESDWNHANTTINYVLGSISCSLFVQIFNSLPLSTYLVYIYLSLTYLYISGLPITACSQFCLQNGSCVSAVYDHMLKRCHHFPATLTVNTNPRSSRYSLLQSLCHIHFDPNEVSIIGRLGSSYTLLKIVTNNPIFLTLVKWTENLSLV